MIAFESDASDLVPGDDNGRKDVFAIKRGGSFGNNGSLWTPGDAMLVSRGRGGQGANGASWGASVDGSFTRRPRASRSSRRLQPRPGDTNGKTDAFVSRVPAATGARLAPGGRRPTRTPPTVAVSGDCKRIAFVTGGRLYVGTGKKVKKLGPGSDPSWSTGKAAESDLVYTGPGGVRLSRGGRKRGKLVGPDGSQPRLQQRQAQGPRLRAGARRAHPDRRQGPRHGRAVASKPRQRGQRQLAQPGDRQLGLLRQLRVRGLQPAHRRLGGAGDDNGASDVYLYTDVRNMTLRSR